MKPSDWMDVCVWYVPVDKVKKLFYEYFCLSNLLNKKMHEVYSTSNFLVLQDMFLCVKKRIRTNLN